MHTSLDSDHYATPPMVFCACDDTAKFCGVLVQAPLSVSNGGIRRTLKRRGRTHARGTIYSRILELKVTSSLLGENVKF
jgi:hypothetical protein